MDHVAVTGSHLAYEESGDGPMVVLCHAGIADHRMWAHQVRALAPGHRVVAYDWRGVGASGPARGDFAHHEDLRALLNALDVERAALVGASMGAGYAVEVALAAPDRVAGLALISPGICGYAWPASFARASRAAVGGAVPAERLAAYRDGSADRVLDEDVRAMARAQARFTVAGPTRDPDDVEPQVWALAVEMLAGIYAREWAERPDQVNAAVTAFLGELGW